MNQDILTFLMRRGPATAEAIATSLGVSQPTVSRLVKANAGRVVRAGGSKNTIYGASRQIRQLQESGIPVFGIDEHGNGSLIGHLSSIYPEGYLWTEADVRWPLEEASKLYFHSLPYFIHDSRPQGFMGRNFAHMNAAVLGVPDNPERWTDDDIAVVMSIMGDDLAGNMILGEVAYRRFMEKQVEPINEAAIGEAYLDLAQRSISEGVAGSSAAGEFPKFTTLRERDGQMQHVIVKFSGNGDSPAERRWSDLLRCEAHAANAISANLSVATAESMAFSHGGRTFMESVRFDRVGLRGRRSMCSLSSLDAEMVGMGDPAWDKFADRLLALRLIDGATASAIRRTWFFGKLIANTDMHAGNLSFMLDKSGRLDICPIYDMLPMRYAPLRGGEVPQPALEQLYAPLPGNEEDFDAAKVAALAFWDAVCADDEISAGFKEIACEYVGRLKPKAYRP